MQQDGCIRSMDKYILHTQANPSGLGKKAMLLPIMLDKKKNDIARDSHKCYLTNIKKKEIYVTFIISFFFFFFNIFLIIWLNKDEKIYIFLN